MPRYIVERIFPTGLVLPVNAAGATALLKIVTVNGERGVTWVQSFVSEDKTKSFCVYDAPSAEDIRQVARRNDLPVGTITQVSVLDPYFYH